MSKSNRIKKTLMYLLRGTYFQPPPPPRPQREPYVLAALVAQAIGLLGQEDKDKGKTGVDLNDDSSSVLVSVICSLYFSLPLGYATDRGIASTTI